MVEKSQAFDENPRGSYRRVERNGPNDGDGDDVFFPPPPPPNVPAISPPSSDFEGSFVRVEPLEMSLENLDDADGKNATTTTTTTKMNPSAVATAVVNRIEKNINDRNNNNNDDDDDDDYRRAPEPSAPYEVDLVVGGERRGTTASAAVAMAMRENEKKDADEDDDDDDDEYDDEEFGNPREVMMGAGVATGVLGLLVGGPIVAGLVGFGAAYAAQRRDGAWWTDAARAVGEVALVARKRARDVNRKHRLAERTKHAAAGALETARNWNVRHRVWDRTASFVSSAWKRAREAPRRHRVAERTVRAAKKFLSFVSDRIGSVLVDTSSTTSSSSSSNHRAAARGAGSPAASLPPVPPPSRQQPQPQQHNVQLY